MSVSYAPTKIKVPDGFETLMEDLTKQILAEQPEDVIGFAATYLKGKLHYNKGRYFVVDQLICYSCFVLDTHPDAVYNSDT